MRPILRQANTLAAGATHVGCKPIFTVSGMRERINILARAAARDNATQARAVVNRLTRADLLAAAMPCPCAFVCVLRGVDDFKVDDVASAIRALNASENVGMNRPCVESDAEFTDDAAQGVRPVRTR